MKGTSLPELLVALAVMLVLASGLARVVVDARAIFAAQPEAADLVQRGRACLKWIADDVALAGAGPYLLADAGPLVRWLPPIHPRRLGPERPDGELLAFADRVTLLTIPDEAPQAAIGEMALPTDALPLGPGPGCPPGDEACGFRPGHQLLAFDSTGTFERLVVDSTAPSALIPSGPLAKAYAGSHGARVAGARIATYYHDRARHQLRRYDGDRSDVPVSDEVIALEFRYFGQPFPPDEPRPPPGLENCLLDRDGIPRLPALTPTHGTLVELTPAMLSDGPWCGVAPYRFDADLYRVRQVRISMHLQAGSPAVRGSDRLRFANPGTSREAGGEVADLQLSADVAPRNLRMP
jgi:hypothetical protein